MSQDYQCWQCGEKLHELILPMSRREECDTCKADQHVCKMCVHFSISGCNEPRADSVSNVEKANFCDYFSPSKHAFKGGYVDKSATAKAQLADLFGDQAEPESQPENELALTPAEIAERKLAEMLNKF